MIQDGIEFILVLDLSKAYDTVLKLLLIEKLKKVIPPNLVIQLRVFISTVIATVTGDITNLAVSMRRGLTQGGTSSPPLFKVFINDLPKALRKLLREKLPEAMRHDPAILVADDVIDLTMTLEQMQQIADECCKWANENGLRWNPLKSQLIILLLELRARRTGEIQGDTQTNAGTGPNTQSNETTSIQEGESASGTGHGAVVKLDEKMVKGSEVADYLGLRVHNRRGLICKEPNALQEKGIQATFMISKEKWFSLSQHPRFLSNIYDTHIRSSIMYGIEILITAERQPLIYIDTELSKLFLKGLLLLKSTDIQENHRLIIQLILSIPTTRIWSLNEGIYPG